MTPTLPDETAPATRKASAVTLHRWLMAAGALMSTSALFPN